MADGSERRETLPEGYQLCAWCASRGSGSSARGLIDTDLSELAASLVNSLVWRPRDEI